MQRLRILAILMSLLAPLCIAPAAFAVQADEVLSDPALETRARALSRQLRCMVCQNQSIDDSDAPLARDLRLLVRERLQQGDSDRQILDFLVARYGEFVLLRPRVSWRTSLLWFGPPVLLLGGALALFLLARRRAAGGTPAAEDTRLTPDEESRLARLMKPRDR
ncbi:MAG: cytochrome c-type biogenesis protein [Xanthobacteraceae bacterium]